ncbi:MAG: reverse transcriptase family protein, partial [Bacteroidota bacterium]
VWRSNRTRENFEIFTQSRRIANRIYHRAERLYNNNLKSKLEEIRQPHMWWTTLKSAIFGSDNSSIPPLLLPNGELATGAKDKAELLHRAFEAKQSAEEIPLPDTCHPEPCLTRFAFRARDVKKILDSLDSWGGVDPDLFFPLFFKMSNILAPKLSRLFRYLFKRGTFPDQRKLSNVSPIPKGALSSDSTQYRPISILPVLSKVAEKLISKPLYRYFERHRLLSRCQYAYRKQLGTCDALLDLTCDIQDNLDKGFEARLVQIDFSAAFDRVNHKALIFKLQNLGIGGYLLKLLRDFLMDRQQRVVVDGVFSEPKPVVSGVPQGSVLGPLLFLVYTSDLVEGLENKVVQYADDTTLVGVVKSPAMRNQVSLSLNRDLEKIRNWCDRWGMKLNASKTKTLLVSRSRTHEPPHPPLCVGDTSLAESEFLNILGVTFDPQMTFEKHLLNVSANAARKLGIVRKASYIYNNEEINATCFRSFVLPLLEYCSPVWISASARDLSLLDRVARGGRFLFPDGAGYDLDHRRMISCLSMFHKYYFSGELPLSSLIPDPLPLVRSTRFAERQHPHALCIPLCRTSQFKRCFLPRTVKQWNELPAGVMQEDLNSFKRRCNSVLRERGAASSF